MNEFSVSSNAAALRARVDLDDLLRRELKVGDPNDPQQVAQALAKRYQNDVRAQAIDGEARGLPFLRTPTLRTDAPAAPTATNVDLEQALHDVEKDIGMLLADGRSKDIHPELNGWRRVIRRSIDEGVAAARFGLDPRKRDQAFAMRRQLGEYARLARLIGVLTPALNKSFRDLAQSIDEACAVILVLLGESMANLGFAGGRFLLQVPFSELQVRRDAVLQALRQVEGLAGMAGGGQWPRGMRAYRQLAGLLELRGQGDLRSLMNEAELARSLDELVQLASGNAPDGLRAIGATAWAPLARLHRFVQVTIAQVSPASPELATLHEALQLFIDGFVPAGGFRLLRVARPAVLNYGLYGPSRISEAELRLIDLVNHRGALARELDCLTDCACDENVTLRQIVLDKLLYDLDRAIDYYCVGDAELGLPELRAAAYSYLIDAVINDIKADGEALDIYKGATPSYLKGIDDVVIGELKEIRSLLRPVNEQSSRHWGCVAGKFEERRVANDSVKFGGAIELCFAQVMHDELCLQRDNDMQWRPLVEQMTSGCISADQVFGTNTSPKGCLPDCIDHACALIERNVSDAAGLVVTCKAGETNLPPHIEESLDRLVSSRI